MKSVNRYPWQHTDMALEDLQCLLDKRRDELLFEFPEYSQNCDASLISEWISLLMKRDDVTQQIVRQDNEKHLFEHLLQLQKILAVIENFSSCMPCEMQHSVSVLCRQVHKYIDECNQTETSSEKQSDMETTCRISETESTQNECIIDAQLSDVIPKVMCSETECIIKAELLDLIPNTLCEIIPKHGDASAVLPDVAALNVDDASELKDSYLTDLRSSTSHFSAEHLSEHKQTYSSGIFSADNLPMPEAQTSNATASNADSLSFMTEKQHVDSYLETGELDKSVIGELVNFLDNEHDVVSDMMPVRSSTPHSVNSSKDDASGTSKAVRRKRSSRNRSRKKSKPSPRTEHVSGNSYRPSLWGLVTNVIGWYNGKPVPSSENKTASLQISID